MNISDTNEKRIIIEFRLTRNKLLVMLTALFVMWFARILGSETLELTTYYPAPYGGYARLLTTDLTVLATNSGGRVGIGTTEPGAKLHVTGDIVAGAAGEEYIFHTRLAQNGDFLHITDRDGGGAWKWGQGITLTESGNVGIGMITPAERLDVNGWIQAQGLRGVCTQVTLNTSGGGGWTTCPNGFRVMEVIATSVAKEDNVVSIWTGSNWLKRNIGDWYTSAGFLICCRIQ